MGIRFHNGCWVCGGCKDCDDCSCTTWTAVAKWSETGDVEEVDVRAHREASARWIAEVELAKNYQPGWEIVRVFKRPPGVSHIT
jgi:hypothetical protein